MARLARWRSTARIIDMPYREKHDWTRFTDKFDALDLFGKAFRRGMAQDAYAGKTTFKARALTDMFPLSANQAMAIDGGATGGTDGANRRYAFKGRILGGISPHAFLPDVCDPAFAASEDYIYKIIAMHTTFISTNVYEGQAVTRGDIVLVELEKSNQTYNLEYGIFKSIESSESPTATADTACSSLVNLVGGWEGPQPLAPEGGTAGTTIGLHANSKPSSDQTIDVLGDLTLQNDLDKPLGRLESTLVPTGIVIHSTVSRSGADTIVVLGKRGLSYHFLVEQDGAIRQLVKVDKKSQHDTATNKDSIGIALVNLSYSIKSVRGDSSHWEEGPKTDGEMVLWEPFPDAQITALKKLISALKTKFPGIAKIGPHSGTSTGKQKNKQDPGPLLDQSIYVG